MTDTDKKHVLCVDDEPDIIYRIKRFIERRYPIEVDVADSGERAMEMLKSKHYDALLTDVSMNGISGLELAAYAIKEHPRTIIVVITGSFELETLTRSKGVRFLAKPVSIKDFEHMIHQNFGMFPSMIG